MSINVEDADKGESPANTIKTGISNKINRRPRTDPVSGEPYASLSVAVRYFYPDTDIIRMIFKIVLLDTEYKFATGSVAEDLNLPFLKNMETSHALENDHDVMECVDFSNVIPREHSVSLLYHRVRPGFCHIAILTEEATSPIEQCLYRLDGAVYLKNNIFFKTFFRSVNMLKSIRNPNQPSIYMKYSKPSGETGISPAFTFSDAGGFPFSSDTVYCFPSPWPETAREWEVRSRDGWPTPGTIKDVFGTGCHLVSKGHPLSWPILQDIEFRFSFSKAEIVLAKSLNHIQKVCYKVFKTLIKCHVKTRDCNIQSYLLKTTLFWACEQTPSSSWELNGLGEKFLFLYDKLLDFLRKHELPHYFIPRYNLIEHLTRSEVQKMISGVEFIRQNPVQCIRDFHSQYRLYGLSLVDDTLETRHFYVAALDILSQKSSCLEELAGNIKEFLAIIGFSYVTICSHEMALSIAKTEIIIDKYADVMLQCEKDQDLNDGLNVLIRTCKKYIELLPRFITLLPVVNSDDSKYVGIRQKCISVLHTELACLTFEMLYNENNSLDDKNRLCGEAEIYFMDGRIASPNRWNGEHSVKYAQFLVIHGRFIEAGMLLQIYLKTVENSVSYVTYNRYTAASVEATLRMIHRYDEGDVHYRAVTLAIYLLAICRKEILGNSVEIAKDHCQVGISAWPSDYDGQIDPVIYDACLLFRFGNVGAALRVLRKSVRRHIAEFYARLFSLSYTGIM